MENIIMAYLKYIAGMFLCDQLALDLEMSADSHR